MPCFVPVCMFSLVPACMYSVLPAYMHTAYRRCRYYDMVPYHTYHSIVTMVWYHIISRFWAESTPTVIGVDPTLSAHVPLAHFLINHMIVFCIYPSHRVYGSVARKALGFIQYRYYILQAPHPWSMIKAV